MNVWLCYNIRSQGRVIKPKMINKTAVGGINKGNDSVKQESLLHFTASKKFCLEKMNECLMPNVGVADFMGGNSLLFQRLG